MTALVCAATLAACQYNGPAATASEKAVTGEDGSRVAYQVSGQGRPALVFIHGWLCDRSYWREQIPVFEQTHRVIALDLTGHGESTQERADWSMQSFGDDVAAVVRQERLSRVVLIGHSMGGPVMLAAAEKLGDRVVGVVGVDTLGSIDQWSSDVKRISQPGALEARMAPMYADYYATIRGFISSMFTASSDPELRRQITEDMASGPKDVGIGAAAAMLTYDPTPVLDDITANRYLINRGPPAPPPNRESVEAHGFDLTVMENVGHFIMLEQPQRFNEWLVDVLAEIQQRS